MSETVDRYHTPTVLVTDAGRSSAVSIIRSLGRQGWRVIATDAEALSPGYYSRFTTKAIRTPSPGAQPDAFVAKVARIAARDRVDLIIPVTDDAIVPISERRNSFPPATVLAIPSDAAQLLSVRDKVATMALAERLSIPIPRTEVVASFGVAARHARSLGWPLVLKPRFSREMCDGRLVARQVRYARSMRDLAEVFAENPGAEYLMQEYWPGDGNGIELLLDSGDALLLFQHRRLREVPPSGGASAYREAVAPDDRLVNHAKALMASVGWTGLAMVEFKVGPRGAALMEVNGRIWGSIPLASASGVDFPMELAHLLIDGDVRSHAGGYAVGTRRRNLELELAWAASVLFGRSGPGSPRRISALRVLAGLPLAVAEMDNFERDDWRPLAAELVRAADRFRRKLAWSPR